MNAPAADPGTDGPEATPPGRPPRPAKQLFASTVLVLEAFVVFFAALVAFGLRLAEPGQVAAVGGALALTALLAAGLVRKRVGYVLGWAVQACLLVSGLVLPAMFVIGAVFLVLWVAGLRVGGRIDRERAERLAAG
jgi:hypothetical protein